MSNSHRLDEIATYNDRSLNTLQRAIAKSRGRFSLILVRCNYIGLRSQVLQLLHERCSLNIQELTLEASTKTLYTILSDRFNTQPPDGVMVLGLESVVALDDLLAATNKVREQFGALAFPVVLWVTDGVFKRLVRVAPDFKNWASPPIEFTLPKHELMVLLQENAEQAFADEPTFSLDAAELKAVQQDLQSQGEELEPEVQASLAFILGLIHARNQQFDEAIHQYQQSLGYWQESQQIERCCIVLFHIALVYYLKGKDYLEETKSYLQQCLERFEQANHPELLAKQINKWGELLRQLEAWEELQKLAEKALSLHQNKGELRQVAQAYSFLAEVALKKSQWQEANQWVQQALEILEKMPDVESQSLGLCYFILAKSQRHLSERDNAIKNLEKARWVGAQGLVPLHQYDPKLFVCILEELRTIKFEQGEYLDAFNLKLEQRKIESQYGLRAFIGAGRLQPPRQVINPVAEGVGVRHEVSIEQIVAASGRQRDVEELIERVKNTHRKLTIIYGPSGVGKSSIVQAALVPALQRTYFEGRDFLPVLVQVYKDWVGTLGECLEKALRPHLLPFSVDSSVHRKINSLAGKQSDAKPKLNLQTILEQLRQNEHRHLLTVLIFDQFEEFFFDNKDQGSRGEFYEFLRQCLEIPYLKVILSLREDYIYYLLELSRSTKLTNIDTNYEHILYYLGKFSAADAKAVIQSLTARSHSPLQPDLIEQLVENLAGKWEKVRPIELQVVGSQLETEKITTLKQYQELGTKPEKKLVERFIEDVVKDCGKENERAAQLVLYLLTNENDTRPLKTKVELREDLELEAEKLDFVLEILEGSGLVFRVPEASADRYQLVHDYLVPFIRQQQSPRLLEELVAVQEIQKLTEEELKQTRKQLEQLLQQVQQERKQAEQERKQAEQERKRSEIAAIEALNSLSQSLWLSQNRLDALVAIVKAARKIQKTIVPFELHLRTLNQLWNITYSIRELNRLEGHRDWVWTICFSPNGQVLASGSADGTLKLWRLDGRQIRTFEGEYGGITNVSFSPDGHTIASAGYNGLITLWHLNGTHLKTFEGHRSKVTSLSFSPTGNAIASTGEDSIIRIWSLHGQLLKTFEGHQGRVMSVSFSPDSQMIASASQDRTVKLWQRLSGQLLQTFEGHRGWVTSVSFSPTGEFIASAGTDGMVKLWNLDGNELQTFQEHRGGVNSISFSPDGKRIASASNDCTVRLWSLNGQLLQTFEGHRDWVTSVSFNPFNPMIASASNDWTVRLWIFDGQQPQAFQEYAFEATIVRFSPCGRMIASAGIDGIIRLWNLEGKNLQAAPCDSPGHTSISFSPNGKLMVSAGARGTIMLWSCDGRALQFLQVFKEHHGGITSVCFSPNGKVIASASGTVKLWNLNGQCLKTFQGHRGGSTSVSFSPSGKIVASAGIDGKVKLWSFDVWGFDARPLNKTFEGHRPGQTNISFSPSGELIASGGIEGTVKLWSLDGQLLQILEGHCSGVNSVCFSPDGKMIASASNDRTVKLWSLDGQLLQTFEGHRSRVTSVCFHPSGKIIASASNKGTVILWNFNLEDLLRCSCKFLRDYLRTNPNVEESERKLCDDILTKK